MISSAKLKVVLDRNDSGQTQISIYKADQVKEKPDRRDLFSLILLTIAVIASLYFCCSYIAVRSSVKMLMNNIESQQKTLETLRDENGRTQADINSSLDLNHVYQVATKELGMVYAGKTRIVPFRRNSQDYVVQADNIPGAPQP
jgi:hypothetical protein